MKSALLVFAAAVSLLAETGAPADKPAIPEGEVEAPQVCILYSEFTYASGTAKPARLPYEVTFEDGRYYPGTIEIDSDGRWNFRKNVNAAGWGPNGAKLDLDFLKQRGDPKLLANGDKIMLRPFVGSSRIETIRSSSGFLENLVIAFKVHETTGEFGLDYASGGSNGFWWSGIANRRIKVDAESGLPIESPAELQRPTQAHLVSRHPLLPDPGLPFRRRRLRRKPLPLGRAGRRRGRSRNQSIRVR